MNNHDTVAGYRNNCDCDFVFITVTGTSRRFELLLIYVQSPQSSSFSVNTGVAMDSNSYLPKQECQFLHLVMEELETYQSDSDKLRYWKTH